MGVKIGSTTGYTDAMMNIVAPKAAQQGYAPDFWISPDGVGGRGRPYPYMIFANMQALGLTAVGNVVKVGDTISDIKEGVNAGVWTAPAFPPDSPRSRQAVPRHRDWKCTSSLSHGARLKYSASGNIPDAF